MFRLRKSGAQAKKNALNNGSEFRWRGIHSWFLIVAALFSGVSYLLQNHSILPIKTIQLAGAFQHIDQQEMEKALWPFVGEGFFSLDIQRVRNVLSDRPWIESISIRRIWPDRLVVRIVEKKPVARWDNNHLISDKANVYAADTDAFQSLPRVHSVNLSPLQALALYHGFAKQFLALDETLSLVAIDSRGAVDIELANGFRIKLGREDVERRIDRLVSIYRQQIKPRRTQIQQLDLRYSNGFAIAWKKEVLIDSDEASLWRNNHV